MLVFLERGGSDRARPAAAQAGRHPVRAQRLDFHRGTFRVRGDVVEIFPAYEEARALRVEFFGDTVEAITEIDPLRGKALRGLAARRDLSGEPLRHRAEPRLKRAVDGIRAELRERLAELRAENKLLEAQRLEQRTLYDLEMLEEMGFCPGIENYSRHLDGRAARRAAADAAQLLPERLPAGHRREPRHRAADRRHVPRRPLAQGDAGRVRLPPAVGARQPAAQLRRSSSARVGQVVYVSATPGDYELRAAAAAWSSSSSSGRPA